MDLRSRLAADLDGSFEAFVRVHQDFVFTAALRCAGSRAEAEELAQETFVRAYRALRGWPPERILALRARPWLARITLNLTRNAARTRSRRPAAAPVDGARALPGDDVDGPERAAERADGLRIWGELVGGLPQRYRAALVLRHVQGLTYREVAEVLDMPVGTAKSAVHRGVELLRTAAEEAGLGVGGGGGGGAAPAGARRRRKGEEES